MTPGSAPIAVVAALKREVAPLLRQFEDLRRLSIPGLKGWRGRLGQQEVVVALSGIGPQRARATTRQLLRSCPDLGLLVSAGFAGGLDPSLAPGDCVAISSVIRFRGGSASETSAPPCDAEWLAAIVVRTGILAAQLVTVDRAAASPRAKAELRAALPGSPAVVDMEGHAVALAAQEAGVPFAAIKVVLDAAGETLSLAPAAWPRLARLSRLASRELSSALAHLVGSGPARPLWGILRPAFNAIFGPVHARSGDPFAATGAPRYFDRPLRIEGAELLPAGPKILACNHQSWLDVCVLYAACPGKVHWMAKSELFALPVLSWFVRTMGAVPLERGRVKSLAVFARKLARGATVIIFPEGTIPGEEGIPRSAVLPETGLLKGKSGAVRLALEAGVPLIPVGISGTGRSLPPEAVPHLEGSCLPRRDVQLVVRFGQALELSSSESVRSTTDRLMRAIAALVDPTDTALACQLGRLPVQATDPAAADAACRRLAGSHYENFAVIGNWVPRKQRAHIARLYAFCRHTDDLGDEGGGTTAERLRRLDEWAEDLERCWAGQPLHPYLVALAHSVRDLGLPREPFLRLIEANRLDQHQTAYASFADLEHYCRHSANPVGEMVLQVFGCATSRTIALSDEICTGLQLANFWQDVRIDRSKGRIYLPLEDLDRFGVSQADLDGPMATEAFKTLLEFEVKRARQRLLAGTELVKLAPRQLRPALGGFIRGGLAILDRIAEQGYDVLAHRPEVPRLAKVAIAARTLAAQAIGLW